MQLPLPLGIDLLDALAQFRVLLHQLFKIAAA
jgi:hypothetical protein